jgi:hypothetical protein
VGRPRVRPETIDLILLLPRRHSESDGFSNRPNNAIIGGRPNRWPAWHPRDAVGKTGPEGRGAGLPRTWQLTHQEGQPMRRTTGIRTLLLPVCIAPLKSLLVLGSIVSIASATVHVVRPDGTGDYPTIQAAVNASVSGDVVELTPGTFTGAGNRNVIIAQSGITIRSQGGDPAGCVVDCGGVTGGFSIQSAAVTGVHFDGITIAHGVADFGGGLNDASGDGVVLSNSVFLHNSSDGGGAVATNAATSFLHCRFVENSSGFGGAVAVGQYAGTPLFDHCEFIDNTAETGGAIGLETVGPMSREASIRYCLFLRNTAGSASAIDIMEQAPVIDHCTFVANSATDAVILGIAASAPVITNSIFAFSPEGRAVYCSASTATLSCCDLYGNAGGDWVGCIAGQLGINGNISADPLFCDVQGDDYRVDAGSPCTPEQNPGCGQIGAFAAGCGSPTPVQPTRWGAIKWMYR